MFKLSVQLLIDPVSTPAKSETFRFHTPLMLPVKVLKVSSGVNVPVNGATPLAMGVAAKPLKIVPVKLSPAPPRRLLNLILFPEGATNSNTKSPV